MTSTTASGAVAELTTLLPGQVLTADDDRYEETRFSAVWNGAIVQQPGVIVQPRTSAEVAEVVRVCRAHGAELTVRGGGRIALVTPLTPSRRGDRQADRVTVRSGGPLGLAARQRSFPVEGVIPSRRSSVPISPSTPLLPLRVSRSRAGSSATPASLA